MNEIELIADQVASGYPEGAWTGISVRRLFRELSPAEAAAHPIPGAHSAWEIALHLAYWHDAVRRRLGGDVVEDVPEADWPRPAPPTDANWRAALDRLDSGHQALVNEIRALTPDKLAERAPGCTFSVYFMLHGIPQHDLYHGGQIMMLTKAMRRT